jgi:Sulfotransferase domain
MNDAKGNLVAERFIYIASMMKSGSSLMWLIASALQEPTGRPAPERSHGVPHSEFLPLSPDTLKWFPNGGVYKNHAPISRETDRFFKVQGGKSIILLRHPADHVAAFYCHQRGVVGEIKASDGDVPAARLSAWWFAAAPTRISHFRSASSVEKAMDHLIADGYLFKMLEWISEWVLFRNENLSIVVTYEQLMNDYDGTLGRLSQLIRGEAPTDDVLTYLRHVKKSVGDEGKEKDRLDKYPFGWTGAIGVWRRYFSPENVRRYNETVEKFLACHPYASGLLAVYPEPFIDASARPTEAPVGAITP